MKLDVECYSGRKADKRPVRFRLDGREYLVEEVLDQWYGPRDAFYKVRADDGNLYILQRDSGSCPEKPDLVSLRYAEPPFAIIRAGWRSSHWNCTP